MLNSIQILFLKAGSATLFSSFLVSLPYKVVVFVFFLFVNVRLPLPLNFHFPSHRVIFLSQCREAVCLVFYMRIHYNM